MRRRVALGVVVGVVVLGSVAAGTLGRARRPEALDRTRRVLTDDSKFVDAPTAAATVAHLSDALLADGRQCHDAGRAAARCDARLSAAAYASVTAFVVAECTAPGIFRARRDLIGYIAQIDSFDHAPLRATRPPEPPPVPSCEEHAPTDD